MEPKDFLNLHIRTVSNKAKEYIFNNYNISFDKSNIAQLNNSLYQLKVIRMKNNNRLIQSTEDLSCDYRHLNQIYLATFDFILIMLIFSDCFIYCKVPKSSFKNTFILSPQHNSECYQTEIPIKTIIADYRIDLNDLNISENEG